MSLRVTVQAGGVASLTHELGAVPSKAETAVRRVVTATTMQVEADVKKAVQRGPKTGRTYTRGKTRTHQASAPGEAPATDTGTLVSRVNREMHDSGRSGSVFSDVDYAGTLERGNAKIDPRPYFAPALDANASSFVRNLEAAVALAVLGK